MKLTKHINIQLQDQKRSLKPPRQKAFPFFNSLCQQIVKGELFSSFLKMLDEIVFHNFNSIRRSENSFSDFLAIVKIVGRDNEKHFVFVN